MLLGIVALYLYFVQEWGPNYMAKRKPFKLNRIVQIYNVVQIVMCTFVFYKGIVLGWLFHYKFACEPVDYSYDPRALEITRAVWIYYMIKILDLLDTVFFVLRKKQNQISFLHVYHHSGMTIAAWATVKFLAGGHITFIGTINSFVHIVMYSYYLAASLQLHKSSWKKYVTQLQLSQFGLILLQNILLLLSEDCGFPKWTTAVVIPQNVFMFALFGDFYYKAYIRKPKSAANGVPTETSNGKLKSQ